MNWTSTRPIPAGGALLALVLVAVCQTDVVDTTGDPEELPVATLESHEPLFRSVPEMAAAADLIGRGTVVEVTSLGILDVADDPNPDEYVKIVIRFSDSNPSAEQASIPWPVFVTDGEKRIMRISYNGITTPQVGEELVLFLEHETASGSAFFGGATHRLLTSDGFFRVVNDTLASHRLEGGRIAAQLNGRPVEDLADYYRR